jgi:hypothetical protein
MSLFRKDQGTAEHEHWTQYWDQRLYECLFLAESPAQRVHGHTFDCTLVERKSTLRHGSEPRHEYRGRVRVQLSAAEYCIILVDLKFQKPDEEFDVPMNEVTYGYGSFGWATDKRVRPTWDLAIRDTNGLADQVERIYAECKATRQEGIAVSWTMSLTPIIGSSAARMWGEWPNSSPRDEAGLLVPGRYPGLHAFPLSSVEFSATL